jgi:tetratricopeptide (TPR) repeat protein
VSLVTLLANVQARSGKLDEAAKLLRDSADKVLVSADRASAAKLHVELGDLMARADRTQEAIAAYETALVTRGLPPTDTAAGDEREFAIFVFEKMIQRLKTADKYSDARSVIDRSRKMLGKDDLFADRQLISLHRETGNRAEALTAVRSVRQRLPNDQSFIRLEATLLTENGKVDEGVALVRKMMETSATAAASSVVEGVPGSNSVAVAVPASDDFSNWLFISNLYGQANRGKQAVEAANQAYAAARGSERKQIARLTLATAQQMSGFLLERDERYQEAFDLIQQAVKIDPTNPSYLDSLGWAYFKLGKLPEAEKYLKEALRFDSSSGTIHEHLGDVYQKQGKADLAKASACG